MNRMKSVGAGLLMASLLAAPLSMVPQEAAAQAKVVQQANTLKGVVKSETGELLIGAVVFVEGTKLTAITDEAGAFLLKGVKPGAKVRTTLIGYQETEMKWEGGTLEVVMKEDTNMLGEVVVTAMGIVRKEKSLTYATQQIKADELMKVQDANLVNSMEGKISGITITPSSGGAGGAMTYLEKAPYCSGVLYLPFVGFVPIDMDVAAFTKSIQIDGWVDILHVETKIGITFIILQKDIILG